MTTTTTRKIVPLDIIGPGGAISKRMPNYEPRRQQIELVEAISNAREARRNFVGKAGTGTGKSFAVLAATVIDLIENDERMVYSTAVKALQDQLALKDLPTLAAILRDAFGIELRYAVMKGRTNYACMRDVERLAETDAFKSPEAAAAFGSFRAWVDAQAENEDVADLEMYPESMPSDLRADVTTDSDDCTGKKCELFERCFVERAKNRAKGAHVVVVSHALLIRDKLIRIATEDVAGVIPDYDRLTIDECFVAGTLVDGRPIETIRAGDVVTAFDTERNVFQRRRVVRTFRRPVGASLVRVSVNGREIVCTPNHKFWTSNGWKRAEHLIDSDIVLCTTLSESVHATTATDNGSVLEVQEDNQDRRQATIELQDTRDGVLFGDVRTSGAERETVVVAEVGSVSSSLVEAYASAESNGRSGRTRADEDVASSRGMETAASRFVVSTADRAADVALVGARMGDRSTGRTVPDRRSESDADDRDRDRRSVALQPTRPGRTEDARSHWSRVDGVAVLEPGRDGTFGGVCRDGHVYNFEVEDVHTYTVSGVVVSNCHKLEEIARDHTGIEITVGRAIRIRRAFQKMTVDHKIVRGAQKAEDERERARHASVENETKFASVANDAAMVEKADAWRNRADRLVAAFECYLSNVRERIAEIERATNTPTTQLLLGDESGIDLGENMTPLRIAKALWKLSIDMRDDTPVWLLDQDRERWGKLASSIESMTREMYGVIKPTESVEWIRYAEIDGDRVKLMAKMVDVSEWLRENLFSDDNAIAVSATIPSNWRQRCGVDNAQTLDVPAPFNYREQSLLFLPDDARAYTPAYGEGEDSAAYRERIARTMLGLTLDARGGAFLLFTSRAAMNRTYDAIAGDLRAAGLLVLKQGDLSPNEMVRQFKDDGNAVLFGLKRFWQGVDVQGSALRLVAIDKLPFPSKSDVLWNAMCEDADRKAGRDMAWWSALAMPHMITELDQGFGRLIRSASDFGIVAILDGRMSPNGGKKYAGQVIRSLPPARITTAAADVAAFYARRLTA